MFYTLLKTWKPSIFQGQNRSNHYFEGWYFKLVDATAKNVVAIIPGVALNKKANDSHSFIQVLDNVSHSTHYHRFPLEHFHASKTILDIHIGTNHFTSNLMDLKIDTDEGAVSGKVRMTGLHPWPVKLFRPGFMGWYAFVPFMQCYHGAVSFDHLLSGSLSIDGRTIDFSGGRGYIEKDWGNSFPRSWIWMQSNHFSTPGTSFMASVATIPWLGRYFTGFGAGLLYKGDFFPFTKWNGTRLENLRIDPDGVAFSLIRSDRKVEVTAYGKDAGLLRSPVFGEMAGQVAESLKGEIHIDFSVLKNGSWERVFSGAGSNGGLEIMGDSEELIQGLQAVER